MSDPTRGIVIHKLRSELAARDAEIAKLTEALSRLSDVDIAQKIGYIEGQKQTQARIEALETALRETRRMHFHSDNSYAEGRWVPPCCGKCHHGDHAEFTSHYGDGTSRIEAATYPSGECTCGADEWNARIDALLHNTAKETK